MLLYNQRKHIVDTLYSHLNCSVNGEYQCKILWQIPFSSNSANTNSICSATMALLSTVKQLIAFSWHHTQQWSRKPHPSQAASRPQTLSRVATRSDSIPNGTDSCNNSQLATPLMSRIHAMALHFSSERPEDQFYTDFGNLNKFEDEVS